jgi:molecular chaperone DnaJ
MQKSEAYSILELSPSSSPEEAKKQYKKLTKKYHPDINKEPNAEDKFKQINQAYNVISKPQSLEHPTYQEIQNIELNLTIDFKESVLGTKKDVKYSRVAKCQPCQGNGEIKLDNGCKDCQGRGQIINRQNNMVMMSTCTKCYGRSNTQTCKTCSGDGCLTTDVSIAVTIPPGILNNNILRLQQMGNYAGTFMGLADQFSDVFCHINVIPDPNLSLLNKDVIYNLNISLLQALTGMQVNVPTINGTQDITVPPAAKNKEEIIIPKLGVPNQGNQKVILNVEYPNVETLISFLQG